MGTRADFYVGRGERAEWLGSIAYDGYPEGITITTTRVDRVATGVELQVHEQFGAGEHLFDSQSEQEFRDRLAQFFANRRDVTLPSMGWPWPWEDSNTTDYAYAFDGGKVWGNRFGHGWWLAPHQPEDAPDEKPTAFPNMKDRTRLAFGTPRDSIMILGGM